MGWSSCYRVMAVKCSFQSRRRERERTETERTISPKTWLFITPVMWSDVKQESPQSHLLISATILSIPSIRCFFFFFKRGGGVRMYFTEYHYRTFFPLPAFECHLIFNHSWLLSSNIAIKVVGQEGNVPDSGSTAQSTVVFQ